MPPTGNSLIFDIGLHRGEDAAYYLAKGYRVVGVDANPLLVADCRQRFAQEIAAGRIVLVNAGVLATQGTFTFYRNLTDAGWSSFLPERGMQGGQYEALEIPCVTLRDLVNEYGLPFFIKTDVEGADFQVISSLGEGSLPAYISCELNPTTELVEKLVEFGYKRFKLINGQTFTTGEPIFDDEPGWRALRKLGRLVPPVRELVRQMPAWHYKAEFDPLDWNPGTGDYSSGPFGEESFGAWQTAGEVLDRLNRLIALYQRNGLEKTFWWDVHARLQD